MTHWGNLEGLIPLVGGVYALLAALGVVPTSQEWRQKYGSMLIWVGPICILFGIALLLGLFSK